jgi:hypothetical protein
MSNNQVIKLNPSVELEPTPPPADWNVTAERVLNFLRSRGLISAMDEGVWFFSGAAESQLAGFLRDMEETRRKNLKP